MADAKTDVRIYNGKQDCADKKGAPKSEGKSGRRTGVGTVTVSSGRNRHTRNGVPPVAPANEKLTQTVWAL